MNKFCHSMTYLILILFAIINNAESKECEFLFNISPKEFKRQVYVDKIRNYNHTVCLEQLINLEKDITILEEYISILKALNVDYLPIMKKIINKNAFKFSDLKKKFLSNSKVDKFISPALKWNENQNYIFIQILYKSNIDDENICDKLDEESFDLLTDSNYVHFEGFCYDKNNTLNKLELNLNLYGTINKLKSLYNNLTPNENGKFTVTLYKKEVKDWNYLLEDHKNPPKNMIKDYNLNSYIKKDL